MSQNNSAAPGCGEEVRLSAGSATRCDPLELTDEQVALLDAFAINYQESGQLSRSERSWEWFVLPDIHLLLMVSGIAHGELQEAAARRIVTAWGSKYVAIAEAFAEAAKRRRVAPQIQCEGSRDQPGHVYVLRNRCLPGLVKIGMTTASPELRVRQLSASTSIPEPFELVESFCCESPRAAEAAIHAILDEHRTPGKEFFMVSEEVAVSVCISFTGGAE